MSARTSVRTTSAQRPIFVVLYVVVMTQLYQTESFFSQRYEANQFSAVTVMLYVVWRQQSDIINRVKRCWEVKQLSCSKAVLSAGRHCHPWAFCLIFHPETQRDSVERPTLRHDTSRLHLVISKGVHALFRHALFRHLDQSRQLKKSGQLAH